MSSRFSFAIACCIALSPPAFAQKGNPARGAKIFSALNCNMCHPGGGNALDPGKSLNTASFLKRYPTDEQVAQRIREGSPNGTMPAFRKDQMSDQDLVDVIAYIRSLNKPKATSTKILCPPAKQTVPIKQPQKKAKSKSA